MGTLLELGDRYWALGLPAAARSAFARALATDADVAPALRLTELALAQGDAAAARRNAQEAVKRAPGAASRILLGRALLAAGELAGARMSLLAALDARGLSGWDRARAYLGLCHAAATTGDQAGAAAQAAAAFEVIVPLVTEAELGRELGLIEEIVAAVVGHGRAADATAMVTAVAPRPALAAVRAVLLGARQAAGDATVSDAAIDGALDFAISGATTGAGAPVAPPSTALLLRRLERRLRRRLEPSEHAGLHAELEAMTLRAAVDPELAAVERARIWMLFAKVCEELPGTRDRAEEAYRRGLAFQPGHTAAACRLALLMLERGDQAGALAEIERALRIDASHGLAWRNAARMLDAQSPSLAVVVGRLLDAANPGAGSAAGGVAPRLVTATAEVARHDVLAGVYAHGHRVKNLLGIIGSRTRSARKLAVGEVADRLRDLETDVTALYEEWALYLRSMQDQTPTVELVAVSALLHEVVVAAQARTPHVVITLEQAAALPDVRGDRMLLREALLNVVSNAAEACATTSGHVDVRVRAVSTAPTAASPLLEIVVVDTGPGIPRTHLSRLFVPGFTTKETGSGVGLAIAERAVAAHHGRITVDSEEGRGTTVIITLPTDKSGLASLPLWITERGAP
jgi:signal transduction histidine kinase